MASTLNFTVTRQTLELIAPAKATPREFEPLSDIDDQESLRFHAVLVQFYRRNPSMDGTDPVEVIRPAIAKALVSYYPLAGRLRWCGPHKLAIDCTGEGVAFAGASADVSLDQFGHILCPPFPNVEELVCPVLASQGLINSPLLHIQVSSYSIYILKIYIVLIVLNPYYKLSLMLFLCVCISLAVAS